MARFSSPFFEPEDPKTLKLFRARLLRLRRGLSQPEVSAKTGLTHSTISVIERGFGTYGPLRVLADFYGVENERDLLKVVSFEEQQRQG